MTPVAGHDAAAPARPPHVVFVLGGLTMGGAESQLTSLLEAGRASWSEWRITVLTLTATRDASLARRLEAASVRLATVDRATSGFARFFARLGAWFRRERPDVVHTMLGGSAGTWGRLAARVAGVPRVVHSDRSLAPRRTAWQRRLEPVANRVTDRFFTNATAVAQRLSADGVDDAKIRIVRNGVDLARFEGASGTELRTTWGVSDTARVAGYLGMLRSEKRPGLLLDAVEALPEADRPDRVVFAGDGVLMGELRDRVERTPWHREHVRLLGLVSDTPSFLAAIDVLVLTSDTEGLPNAVIEAMAAGVPCIATRVSDVPELVTDNGFVVEPGDVSALAEAIRRVRRMPTVELRALGRNGRVRAEATFELRHAAERFRAVHDELLADLPVRRRR